LTTLKIIKKPSEAPTASKAPVRRADPHKRDRTVAPPKVTAPTTQEVSSKSSQRNHRHDGKPHGYSAPEHVSERPLESKPDENRPLRSSLRADTASESKPAELKQHKPAGVDTRVTPRPDKNEPQYRQAPRRGGKVRDGYDGASQSQYGAAAKAAYKSSPVNVDSPRLSKVMAERGLCSRREADEWIINGWVKVDGVIMETLGSLWAMFLAKRKMATSLRLCWCTPIMSGWTTQICTNRKNFNVDFCMALRLQAA
jgi:23S rRNA pseudouridine2604 synthase